MTPKGDDHTESVPIDAASGRVSPSFRKTAAIGIAILVLALGIGIYRGVRDRAAAETELTRVTDQAAIPTVAVVKPEGSPPDQEIVLPGNVQAYADTPIYARASGYLRHWYFDIGAHVKAGDLLAEIETPEVDEQLRQAQADLATAQANLSVADVTWKRNEALYKNNWVSGQVRDNTFGTYNADKTIVDSKQADVTRLERMQSYEKVYAPFDGIITARHTDVGALIDAGASGAARELFHLSSIGKVRVFVAVPETYIRSVHPGAEATVTVSEFPNTQFHGVIARSTNAIDPVSRTLTVEVDADNPDDRLLPGAYAFVHLTLPSGTRSASMTVPAETVIFRKEGISVAVVRNGRAELVPIKIGRDYGTKVEVISGLELDDEVILNPSDSLTSGTAVHTQSTPSSGSSTK